MRVRKHGCGVKMFWFSRANHPDTKFLRVNTRQVYFIYPLPRRLTLEGCVNFLLLKPTFLSEKNPFFGKHLFGKTSLVTSARLRVQAFSVFSRES